MTSVAEPVKALHDFSQASQERVAIHIVIEDVFPPIAAGRHMVEGTVKLQPKRTRHTHDRCHIEVRNINIQDLMK